MTRSLVGNKIEMEKAYVAALDNLDTSYYTYSYYGVDSDGNPVSRERGDPPAQRYGPRRSMHLP